MDLFGRIRAMLRTAVIWGAAWTVPGLVWTSVLAFLQRNSSLQVGLSGFVWTVVLNWTIVGSIGGAAFALTLSVAERRQPSLGALSMRRVVSWGAIGGAALPLVVLPLLPIVAPALTRQAILAAAVYGLLGAVSAGASLHLARRGDETMLSRAGGLNAVPPAT